jgi:membrane fusion protein (multidrug efflux system)
VASIVNRDELYTEIRVPQRRLPSLRVALPVEIRAETYPDLVFTGRVETIHPTVDANEGSVKVRVSVADPQALLRPGIYVSATVVLSERSDALLVPKRARVFEGNESVIFVIRDGKAVRLALSLGLQTADDLEVVARRGATGPAGLRDDDLIVVRGQTQVRDGSKVEIHEPAGAPEENETAEEPKNAELGSEPASSAKKG